MTCSSLADSLSKHFKLPAGQLLRIFAGSMLIAGDSLMSDVHGQCMCEDSGGLYVTVRLAEDMLEQEELQEGSIEDEVKAPSFASKAFTTEEKQSEQARPMIAENEVAVLAWKLQDAEAQLLAVREDAEKTKEECKASMASASLFEARAIAAEEALAKKEMRLAE